MHTADRPVRFLLAEDDADHADLVMRALRKSDVSNEFAHVRDGEEALAYLRRQPPHENVSRPDVIVLDLKMPRMDGHELLEVIKVDPDLAMIPVVVLTTSKSEADRARAYGSHANSYLVKPLDFQRFHEMISQLGVYWSVWNEPPV